LRPRTQTASSMPLTGPMMNKTVVLGVTGSVACYKAPEIVRRLKDRGVRVKVVMTRAAECFVTPLTFQAVSAQPVYGYRDFLPREEGTLASIDENGRMPHISLARQADVLLMAPATANILGKMATGIADDLLSCLWLTFRGPVVVAPAMNTRMWAHPIVQENVRRLREKGVWFVGPEEGLLACEERGAGRLADVQDIVESVWTAMRPDGDGQGRS